MKKILVFDDEEDILEIVKLILKDDYEIHTESYLDDPEGVAQKVSPDLILLDFYIPPVGGEEAIKLLRQNEQTQDMKIIIFSASNDIADQYRRTGADGYFTKPFKVKQLKKFLKEQLPG